MVTERAAAATHMLWAKPRCAWPAGRQKIDGASTVTAETDVSAA